MCLIKEPRNPIDKIPIVVLAMKGHEIHGSVGFLFAVVSSYYTYKLLTLEKANFTVVER